MDNFYTYFVPDENGCIVMPIHADRRLDFIAVQDIGDFVAEVLIAPDIFKGLTMELASEALTMPEVAEQLSKHRNKPISFVEIPVEEALPMIGEDLAIMFRWYNNEDHSLEIEQLKQHYPITPVSFAEFIATKE